MGISDRPWPYAPRELLRRARQLHLAAERVERQDPKTPKMVWLDKLVEVDTLTHLATAQLLFEIHQMLKSQTPGATSENPIDIRPDLAGAWDEGWEAHARWVDSGIFGSVKPENPYKER
jgi:hypothetical protein